MRSHIGSDDEQTQLEYSEKKAQYAKKTEKCEAFAVISIVRCPYRSDPEQAALANPAKLWDFP